MSSWKKKHSLCYMSTSSYANLLRRASQSPTVRSFASNILSNPAKSPSSPTSGSGFFGSSSPARKSFFGASPQQNFNPFRRSSLPTTAQRFSQQLNNSTQVIQQNPHYTLIIIVTVIMLIINCVVGAAFIKEPKSDQEASKSAQFFSTFGITLLVEFVVFVLIFLFYKYIHRSS